ncbi:hypothetical protein J2Y48_002497 [Mycoplana sp. BE70]|uniref:hypothetical protein n=1 Tax=Mycoplana sp. BE70 TaxID=2817775 RepID=UPI00285A7062|nr:hypothetical protein [Mycoplana sp. BE70]MDR6757201.1 hypothetical protein [Mycoplana sp. BE70]
MTLEMNETTSTESAVCISASEVQTNLGAGPVPGRREADALLKKAKDAVSSLKTAEARGRKALAAMVATFVEMGEAYITNAEVTTILDAKCRIHGIEPVKLTGTEDGGKKSPNIFLPLVRLIDGDWEQTIKNGKAVTKPDGTPKTKWVPNRSFEKYASVIRFFIHNQIGHEMVAEYLVGEEPIVLIDGKTEVAPTITEIVKADTAQQNSDGRERTVWTVEAKASAAALQPLFTIPYTETLKAAFTLSEDNYGSAIIRLGPNGLEILGDTGMKNNGLLGVVKRQTPNMASAFKKAIALLGKGQAND